MKYQAKNFNLEPKYIQHLVDAFAASASPDCSALKRFLKQKFPSGRTKVFSDWTRRHLGYKIGYHDVRDHILPALEERFDDELRAAGAMKSGYQPWPTKEEAEARRFSPSIQVGCSLPLSLQYNIGPREWKVGLARRSVEYRSGRLGAFRGMDFVADDLVIPERFVWDEFSEIDKTVWDKVNLNLPRQDEPIQKMVDNHIADALTYGIGTCSINLAEKPLTLEDVSDTIKKYYRITHPKIHEFFQESSMNESKPKPTPFFETVTTRLLRGADISQMSNRDINAEIKSEEIKVKTLEEIEHKTKATMREIAERKQAIADVVTYLDSLEDTEAK